MYEHFLNRLPSLNGLTPLVCFRCAINKAKTGGRISNKEFNYLRLQLIDKFNAFYSS